MSVANPYRQYRETQVLTATGERLVLLLFEAGVRLLGEGIHQLESRNLERANGAIVKTQQIIAELMGALKLETGPIAQNLYALYDFIGRKLIEANVRKDPGPARDALAVLAPLKEAWAQLCSTRGQ